jgi:predicted nucleic acid-binding protein
MITFDKWQERIAANTEVPTRIRYTRKSTESGERQIGSHVQQGEAADREWGVIDATWVWQDNFTGTTFDRPQLQDMLGFCRAHPRPRSDPGRIEMYDPSRFGRILDDEGRPDVAAYQQLHAELTKLGWRPQFVTVKTSGDSLSDIILLVLHAHMAASYSVTLSTNVTRGMVKRASEGWWTGGSAPWGTLRKDVAADRLLKDHERSSASANTILVPNDVEVAQWTKAARLIVGGMSLDGVGRVLYNQDGVSGKRGGRMTHSTMRKLLTNTALIGRLSFRGIADAQGIRPVMTVDAKWPPIVDVELFEQVQKRLFIRGADEAPRRRRHAEQFPLTLVCAHCGLEYNGGKLKAAQGGARMYAHSKPKNRRGERSHERFKHAGCKVWYVDAEEIETKIKDLIVRERSSEAFEDQVRQFLLEKDSFAQSSSNSVADAEKTLRGRRGAYERAAKIMMATVMADSGASVVGDDVLTEQLAQLRRQVAVAEANVQTATQHAESGVRAFEKLSSLIHETRNIGAAWDRLGGAERRSIFDHWVYAVYIAVEPIKGMRRANRKTAVVLLRTDPYAPRHFEMAGSYVDMPDRADAMAVMTSGAASTAALDSSAATAAVPPSLLSAQAACDLTSGSSSSRAPISVPTSDSVPTLPSTTPALRLSPTRLARFIGEPLNEAENSACDMDRSCAARDRASCPSRTGLAANAANESSRENLRLYGHTS